jgi:hypothetical protein
VSSPGRKLALFGFSTQSLGGLEELRLGALAV